MLRKPPFRAVTRRLPASLPSLSLPPQIDFVLLISRAGKVRLSKWYGVQTPKDKVRITREVAALVLARAPKMCNFLEWKERKLVYRRYASLFFVASIGKDDNELLALEIIHHYVEVLDKYFGNVCELDIIFNFHKAYYILDELLIGGELQETNKKEILRVTAAQDELSKEEEGVVTRR
jgi:AP-1 complex subunit sigma 1/2